MSLGVVRYNKQSPKEQLWSESDLKTQLGTKVPLWFNVLITV